MDEAQEVEEGAMEKDAVSLFILRLAARTGKANERSSLR
jgi:hypothetical protein